MTALVDALRDLAREGELYERLREDRVRCYACGHRCLIPPGQRGVCKVRWNEDGRLLVPTGYVAGLQLDPVEKKPFFHAYPGARALSFGMLGCDLHCSFCFPGDTPVLTPTGAVSIKSIFDAAGESVSVADGEVRVPKGTRVIAASGEMRPVLEAFRHAYRGSVSVIKPMYLPAVRCTPDHRWLATTDPSRETLEEVAARDLTPAHFLVVPKPVWPAEQITLDVAAVLKDAGSYFLIPVAAVSSEAFDGDVYNLEVEKDHSYVAGFCAVKNCQNALTSQALRDPMMGVSPQAITARDIVDLAQRRRARLLTSTYNEPLITSEWAVEVFREGRARGLVGSFVSNGNATPEVLDYLRPWVDLYKVDLKGFDDKRYRELGCLLRTVLDTIQRVHRMGFWLEVVTLVIPGFNDADAELRDIAQFLAGVSPDIPWHVTAFRPEYRMTDRGATPVKTLLRAAELGLGEGLRYVYAGNLPGRVGALENTHCPGCDALLIERVGYTIRRDLVTPGGGACPSCGTTIPGRW
ncbi:MAG: radical SAM protein [Candidatus Rokubacteria bacterium]|nr:radical SAM protein [Candidatus Rokubacteria bacterium]